MIRKLDEELSPPPPELLPGPPTQPGWYWWKRDAQSHEMMVQVHLTNGELTVWWADRDIAIVKLRGYWLDRFPHPRVQ